ncbi:ATP-dependent DNA helicase RecG [Sulfurihydrogenibium subterraneum]|uniref:ATP-dependent DNA helicase RecG n=1 Tax=Sulfurihydrogenibium subterraneum TaxID=171121 RepID=UPI00048E323A|nr:ATP-dependent DNA helicase RecG [Sulfurihydrogenibium subterraneum]
MENNNPAKNLIEKLINADDTYLSRVKNLSDTLTTLLKGKVPEGIIQDLHFLDSMNPTKKRNFLRIILSHLNSQPYKEVKPTETEEKPKNRFTIFDLEKYQIENLSSLTTLEKKSFKKIMLKNVYQALYNFPEKYEDRRVKKILKVKDGETGTFYAQVEDIKRVNRGKLKVEVILKQDNVSFSALFFYDKPYLYTYFRKGKTVKLFGKVNVYKKTYSLVQPELLEVKEDSIDTIAPVYSLRGDSSIKTTGQTINHLRRGIFKIVEKFSDVKDFIPSYILEKYGFPPLSKALKFVHHPDENADVDDLNNFQDIHQKRLIFDELFLLQLAQKYRKALLQRHPSYSIKVKENFLQEVEKNLPFQLTNAQRRTIKEILSDLEKDIPMNRMILGDVGSGKTVVAAIASLAAALNNYQSAVMAPTEILAQQHYNNFKNFLKPFLKDYEIALLTGSLSSSEKKKIYKAVESGIVKVVIGTHALLEEKLKFKDLALVVVDEQHRFGVEQRKSLIERSEKKPHVMVMTATPIPRTLALAYYGDLDISKLDELPKGRKPVKTVILFERERDKLYSVIKQELEKGRQVFVVYPLIQESEKTDLKSAEEGFKHYQEAFPDYKVVLLHGKMKQEEKDRIMQEFKEGKAHILVSTTVIEVGVDIPNATVMVIEEAHRFGLSQIHQLRGRIGRGQYEGYCFLMAPDELSQPQQDSSKEKSRLKALERLKILVKTSNGFEIAEKDLELRGAGDIAGTRQSGESAFMLADLKRDEELLEIATKEAQEIINQDPTLSKYKELKDIIYKMYADRFDLVNIA